MSNNKHKKYKWMIGVDEAGRGPLAGPVSVGVFAVPAGFDIERIKGVKDSKKLSEKQRDEWYKKLKSLKGVRSCVAFTSSRQIDSKGIVWSVKNAMRRALNKLKISSNDCIVLLDGALQAPKEYKNQKTIIKGDAKEPVISSASILAKVERDRKIIRLSEKYPKYKLDKHKGYGTKYHREMIKKYGLTEIHRKSFCKNII